MLISVLPLVALLALLIFERRHVRRRRGLVVRDALLPEEREAEFDARRKSTSAEVKAMRKEALRRKP